VFCVLQVTYNAYKILYVSILAVSCIGSVLMYEVGCVCVCALLTGVHFSKSKEVKEKELNIIRYTLHNNSL
jgi:hypothetical protein